MGDSVIFKGRTFKDLEVGECFADTITVTESHVILAAGLFKDFNALHTHAEYMKGTRFKGKVVHGALTLGIMVGVYSNYFHATDISTVEVSAKFTAPVYPGDTLTTEWKVLAKEPKRSLDGGLAVLKGSCRNQNEIVVAEMEAKLLISNQPFSDMMPKSSRG